MRGNKRASNDKAKNFKGAISRLLSELKGYKILISVALILAALGSVISIFTPNMLKDLTNKISDGVVINRKNIEIISSEIEKSFNEKNLSNIIPIVLEMDLTKEKISNIMKSDLSYEDKALFNEFINERSKIAENIYKLPNEILRYIFVETKYNGNLITVEDKIVFINSLRNKTNISIPDSIANIIFRDIVISDVTITSKNQADILKLTSSLGETSKSDVNKVYSLIDKMPDNVKKLVEPSMDINGIKKLALILVSLYLISAIFTYIESISMTNVSNKFAKKLRNSISVKINKLPLKYFDKTEKGDILSRVTNDVDLIAQSMNNSLSTLVSAITLFIGTVIMMFITNYLMAITAILSSIFGFVFMAVVLSKSQKYFDARQKELGKINGHIEEVYSGLNVVKAYNGRDEADKKFDELNKNMYQANRKSQFLSGLMMPMMSFIGNFGYVAVCIVGALLVMNNKISFGVIVAFIVYVRLFTSPLSQIAQSMTSLQSTAASSERIFDFIDEEEMTIEKSKKTLDKLKVKGKIEFKNVSFTYDGNDSPTIKNFNANIKPGQKIAIVGPTGAGKTTMVNLLMKFYEINSGDIKIDGISIKDLTRENIHELFTMVLQDSWLFDGTLKENIVYNRECISDEKVIKVCKEVGLHHFIKTLPNGYNSTLSDNDSVSAGQRQLLTIARAMIEETPFLILDEATSNVDTRTEELVQKAMDKLTKGKTSFIIAHRLSTIKNADLILVMKDGNIIEQGNHEELMKNKGFYSELYNSQFEL